MSTTTDPDQTVQPGTVRLLATPDASLLAELMATFEDLQTVLRCCERLVSELADDDGEPDGVLVEAAWTMALLSYSRCFSVGEAGSPLTEEDLALRLPEGDVLHWHNILLQLRDHYADAAVNPREQFSVGVAQNREGVASGVAITSARQPLVDLLTVRQAGAVAYALLGLVNDRIEAQQEKVFGEVEQMPKADLDALPSLDVAHSDSVEV